MKLKIISLMLVMLVIMLTPAYALQMDITQYSGADEINGYARSADQITIEAAVEMFGSPTLDVAARRLKVYHSGISSRFNSCSTAGATTYRCTYSTTGPYSGEQQFRIELLDADGNMIETIDKTIIIDNLAPEITLLDITPKKGTNNRVTINYKAEDYAKTSGDISSCSGLQEIGFYVNNQKVAAESGQRELCSSEKSIQYTRTVQDYEKITLCARATDLLNQQSDPVCSAYEIDNQGPQIISVQIKDADGFDITGMRTGANIAGSVEARIVGNEDDVDTVFADLSILNPSLTGDRVPNQHYGDTYVWENIQITNPSTCQVTIKATDTLGNQVTETKSCSIATDDSGPEGVKIETNYTDEDGTYLLSSKGTITAEIREAGAGLFKKHVYMDLAPLGRHYSTQQRADSCTVKTGDVWECKWTVEPSVADKEYTIRLSSATRDDLDNTLQTGVERTIRVDTTPPVLDDVDFSIIHSFAEYGDKTVKGDTLEYEIKTLGTFYAYSNFTGIGGSYTPGTCSGEDIRTCEFSQTITKSGPDNASIDFEFFDRAGNKLVHTEEIIIYGLSNDLSPEYWTSTVECSPSLIDRSTTAQKEQLIYCHIKLDSTNNDAIPVFTSIDTSLSECYGNKTDIAEIKMMNNGMGSKDPYMVIELELTDFAVNELNFTCPIHIATSVGNFFSKADERENININLEFYDLPLDEIYSSIEEDINQEMKKAMNYMSWIDDVEKYTEMARKICGYKTTFTSLLSALDGVAAAFVLPISIAAATDKEKEKEINEMRIAMCQNIRGPAEKWLYGDGTKGPAEKLIGPKGGKEADEIWKFFDLFCNFINCRLTWDDAKYATNKQGIKEGWDDSWGGTIEETFLIGGGGGGWGKDGSMCKSAQNIASLGMGDAISKYNKLANQMQSGQPRQQLVDVKESLVWSTLCFCGPGIMYNLNKMRQISCKYALCLAEDVKTKGIDPSWCRAEKSYLTCTYVMGEVFSIFPFLAFYDKTVNAVKEWFENPLTIIGAVSGCMCGGCVGTKLDVLDLCDKDSKLEPWQQVTGYLVCILPKTAAKILDAIASVKSMPSAKDYEIGNSYCDQAKAKGLDKL